MSDIPPVLTLVRNATCSVHVSHKSLVPMPPPSTNLLYCSAATYVNENLHRKVRLGEERRKRATASAFLRNLTWLVESTEIRVATA